jgi:hypothetical protein
MIVTRLERTTLVAEQVFSADLDTPSTIHNQPTATNQQLQASINHP